MLSSNANTMNLSRPETQTNKCKKHKNLTISVNTKRDIIL